ncbi:MAG: hypothetical protein EZS28_016594 [Streblomastix strix]|uniref:Uncharacterized protein n=1 Tax=Streblomastix strix TaxID=222440 RepID=A0A5J4VZ89_9EUKA|nr:MAG: hypothetical protein EZS28_016594 [Streblomastix strix]
MYGYCGGPAKQFQAYGACGNGYQMLNGLGGPYCQIAKGPAYCQYGQNECYALISSWVGKFSSPGLIRSAAIGFTSKTLGSLPNILAKIIAGVRACLAGVWRVFARLYCDCKLLPNVNRSVPVIGMSDAQLVIIFVCSVCAIVDSSVFRRNSGVQLAVPRAIVQRAKVNCSPKCQSHADKLTLPIAMLRRVGSVNRVKFCPCFQRSQVGLFPILERLIYISGRLLSAIQSYKPLAAPGWSRSSKVKSGPRSVPRGVQWPLQLRDVRSLLASQVATSMLRRSVILSRGRSKIDQFRAHPAGQRLRAEQATAYEEQLVGWEAEKVPPSTSRGSGGKGPSGNVSQQKRKNEVPNGDIHTLSPQGGEIY